MSHTTTIDKVIITDIAALRSAIAELKGKGVNCELLESAKPRAYYANQEGMGEAPYVIQLSDASYDIGLYEREDNKGYDSRTDLYGGTVQRSVGVKQGEGESKEQAAIGKVLQMYGIHATTRKAAQQGYQVTRTTKNDGTVQLQIAS